MVTVMVGQEPPAVPQPLGSGDAGGLPRPSIGAIVPPAMTTRRGRGGVSGALAGIACLLAVSGAAAQEVDAEIEPYPFDPRLEIREHFRLRMPTYWWYNEPEFNAGVFTVVVHIPDMWRGNPTGAVMRLCPDHDHRIWRGVERLMVMPFYRKRPWPAFECRP